MELAEGASVAELLALHREGGKAAGSVWDSIAVAVNQEYARADDVLKDGEEVALLPPVSGGLEGFWGSDDNRGLDGRAYPRGSSPILCWEEGQGDPRLKPWAT
jgi:molybdopterin converting factor small subunit